MKTKAQGTLASVNAGEYVWIDQTFRERKLESTLMKVDFVNVRGRLYISDKSLWNNWRYGFNPLTGKAQGMDHYTMRYASPEEIETELARLKAIEEEDRIAEEVADRNRRIRSKAAILHTVLRVIFAKNPELSQDWPEVDGIFAYIDQSPTYQVAAWLNANGFVGHDGWTDEQFSEIAKHFKGEIISTGGGIDVVLIPQENGDVVGIGEECVVLYRKQPHDESPEATFFNPDAQDIATIAPLVA